MADMTSYADAMREVSAARGEIPARRAYPGYLYSDLASLYERCGRVRGRPGSVTIVPVLTMPAATSPTPCPISPDTSPKARSCFSHEVTLTGCIRRSTPLSSLSRLMRNGAGPGRTRDDHLAVAEQLLAALAKARQVRELAELIGPEALSRTDRRYLDFDDAFARELVNQRPDEARELNSTLDRAWQVIRRLPERELVMLPTAMLAAHPDTRNLADPHAG